MTVKELKEAINNILDNAEVLLIEAEDWQCEVVNQAYRLNCEYLYDQNYVNRMLFLEPK